MSRIREASSGLPETVLQFRDAIAESPESVSEAFGKSATSRREDQDAWA
jgi:hypothetical protein